jgi:hypothetical protein
VVKVGLIAPFEGLGRPLGYAVLPAVEHALAEANASGELGRYRVALVALNDDLYGPSAAAQSQALAQQVDVVGALGLWSDDTMREAAPILAGTGIATLTAVPLDEDHSGVYSLCPSVTQLAAQLLSQATRLGETPIVIAGPQNALAEALEMAAPELSRICVDTAAECADPCATSGRTGGPSAPCRAPVIYVGDASSAADHLVSWRSSGWQGTLLGGPELARPWLPERSGVAGEGVRAVVCSYPAAPIETGDVALDNESRLAYAGTRMILRALARDIAARGRPSRPGVGVQLVQELPSANLAWLRVEDGRWTPAR